MAAVLTSMRALFAPAPAFVIDTETPADVVARLCRHLDGLPLAVEAASGTGVIGVQWHPEWRFRECPDSTAIFQAFGRACAGRAALRRG